VLAHHECAEQRKQGDGIDAESSMTGGIEHPPRRQHQTEDGGDRPDCIGGTLRAEECKCDTDDKAERGHAEDDHVRPANQRACHRHAASHGSGLDRSRLRAGTNRPPNALRVPQPAAHAAQPIPPVSALR